MRCVKDVRVRYDTVFCVTSRHAALYGTVEELMLEKIVKSPFVGTMPRTVESSMRQVVVMPVPGGEGVQTDVVDRSARRRYDTLDIF